MTSVRRIFEWGITAIMFASLWYWNFKPIVLILWIFFFLLNAFWNIFSLDRKLRELTTTVEELKTAVDKLSSRQAKAPQKGSSD